MSPLTCSLFALAAVLATAHGDCITKRVGDTTDTAVDYLPIYFQPPGVKVHFPVNNCPPGMQVVGEDITTCNNDPNGPAPRIDESYPSSWDYTASCSDYECPQGASTTVKQYCDNDYQRRN